MEDGIKQQWQDIAKRAEDLKAYLERSGGAIELTPAEAADLETIKLRIRVSPEAEAALQAIIANLKNLMAAFSRIEVQSS